MTNLFVTLDDEHVNIRLLEAAKAAGMTPSAWLVEHLRGVFGVHVVETPPL